MHNRVRDFPRTVTRARAGDDDAWAELYRAYAPLVLGYLRAQRAHDADDLLGDTWVSAVRSIGRFEGDESAFNAWLLRIAHNRMIDAARSASRRPVTTADEVDELANAATTELLDASDAGDSATADILAALASLGAKQRSVLYLRYVADLSFDQIGSALGMRTTAVRVTHHRALKELRSAWNAANEVAAVTFPQSPTLDGA